MGGWLSCMENRGWDSHPEIRQNYTPGPPQPQDMTQPLSHYFISSGHNSYLEGNQLTSKAGVATIVACLEAGCKVIELDTYDGPKGAPIATHGGTLTSSVTVHDCLVAIKQHGFSRSPWPVILTLENHAGVAGQQAMAAELKSTLGDHLFEPTPEQLTADAWLSPQQLQNKVLVRMKVKEGSTAPELAQLVYIRNSKIAGYDLASGPKHPVSHSLPESKLPQTFEYTPFLLAKARVFSTSSTGSATGTTAGAGASSDGAAAPAAVPAAADGSAPAAATAPAATATAPPAAAAKRSKQQPLQPTKSATEAEMKLEQEQDDTLMGDGEGAGNPALPPESSLQNPSLSNVFKYSARHLLRVYPGALRMFDNSNPSPHLTWAHGGSLAALNWQLWDEAVATNLAFFTASAGSGYVLKPDWMTTSIPDSGVPERPPKQLQVTVYCAHVNQGALVSFAKDDIYVQLELLGVPCDCVTARTKHVNNSGNLVVEEMFTMAVKFPELAVLLVKVRDADMVVLRDSSDTTLGINGLSLATLAPGDYCIRLYGLGEKPHKGKFKRDMWVKVGIKWV